MRFFGIALGEANDEIERRINEAYPEPDSYRLSDTFYLVMCDSTAALVAKAVGLRGDNLVEGARGVVIRLAMRYSGRAESELWDWLERVGEHS